VSRHRDEHLDLCAALALGILEGAERAEIEAHLAQGCGTCDAELGRMGHGALLMAVSAPPLAAPATLRVRVMEAVRGQATPRPIAQVRALPRPSYPRRRAVWTWAWGAALAVIAVAGVMQYRRALDLEHKLAAASGELERLRHQVEEEARWAALPSAPRVKVVTLAATPAGSSELIARVTYDPDTRRAVVMCDHFTAPAGSDYQLWAIHGSGPSSLGLVRPDRAGRAVIRLPDAGDPASLAAFAVSLEKEGGAPTPNAPAGPVVMVGKIPS